MSVNLLCIESSYHICSVSISSNGNVFIAESATVQNHAESLMALIQDCIGQANITLSELSAVAISSGPGSYTGLRIGTSTAKGICFALDIPLMAIDTLCSLSYGASCVEDLSDCFIWPMIDARRMEVYHCVFDSNLNAVTEVTNGIITDSGFVPQLIQSNTVICGDGADKAESILGLRKINVVQHAKYLCKPAELKYSNLDFEDLEKFEPFYLKFANITTANK
jgi:tRNA threonylcarbamoyladenosine biosynthesis protein TsaB